MRDILFRGKRTDNGEWVEGSLFQEDGWTMCGFNGEKSGCFIIETGPISIRFYMSGHAMMADNEFIQVSEKTVGQFTGLTDKNGVKIFEGDYVIANAGNIGPDDGYGCVEWDEDEMEWIIVFDGFMTSLGDFYSEQLEKSGNCFDNPELLESTT